MSEPQGGEPSDGMAASAGPSSAGSGASAPPTSALPASTPPSGHAPARAPGWREVLLVSALVVVVVLGAAALTGLLPTDAQRLVFHTPLAIGVLVVGTVLVLWRVAGRRPPAA